jgi:hypothetical protein
VYHSIGSDLCRAGKLKAGKEFSHFLRPQELGRFWPRIYASAHEQRGKVCTDEFTFQVKIRVTVHGPKCSL